MKNIFFLVILITGTVFSLILYPGTVNSATPTNVKDTLSSSQLSYFARMGTGVSAGESLIRVALGTSNPTNDTNNLFVGDTIGIGTTSLGTTGPMTTYVVKDIGSTATFQITTGLGTSNTFVGAAIVSTRSAIHTISFTPQTNYTGGYWEFLIKASNIAGEVINDGIPDMNGFDLGSTTPGGPAFGVGTRLKNTDVNCPAWGIGATTAFSVGTTAVITSSVGTTATYHVISCYLGVGGTNAIGVGYTVSIGKDLASGSQLINPSPKDNNEGAADVYTFYIRHRDSAQLLIDSDTIQGKIALIEAVRVTATIDPTLTFTIDSVGVGAGANVCGTTMAASAANTTATQVAFGSVSLSAANDLGHRLTCTTNSINGYVVTVYESGKMKNITTGTTIPDTNCGGNICPYNSGVGASWTTFNTSGWGYTTQSAGVGTTVNITSPNYRAFGDGPSQATSIMYNNITPQNSEQAYICYRLTASTTQEAGNYENKLIYTATATF